MRFRYLWTLLILSNSVTVTACRGARTESLDTGGRTPPGSMREWVDAADLIVGATIQDVRVVGPITGFAEDGSAATVTPPAIQGDGGEALPAFPLVETVVHVDAVYKDTTGTILPGQTIAVVRMDTGSFVIGNCPTDATTDEPGFPIIQASGVPGTQMLYALKRESPAGMWHSTNYSDLARLMMAGPLVVSGGCPPADVSWTENLTPEAFRSEMIGVINSP